MLKNTMTHPVEILTREELTYTQWSYTIQKNSTSNTRTFDIVTMKIMHLHLMYYITDTHTP